MSPGTELDTIIAEKVMGWKSGGFPGYDNMFWVKLDGSPTDFWKTDHGSQECEPFSPSTDIACAWLVVEKLDIFKKYELHQSKSGKWQIGWGSDSAYFRAAFEAETVAHVICLAALSLTQSQNVD